MEQLSDPDLLNSIFTECRQCGTCCRKYRKIAVSGEEAEFITRMGGHVGVDLSMREIRELGLEAATARARQQGKLYMIHPDGRGCVFLRHHNDHYICSIYHYRPQTCRGFHCNLADGTFLSLFGSNATALLGQDSFGLPLQLDPPAKK